MKTSGEVGRQLVSDQQSPVEVTHHQCGNVTCDRSVPPTDHNSEEWQLLAARQVDLHLLLNILLARKHRDPIAKEFLVNLPPMVLKNAGRQHPIFVCLDIVN